MWGEPTLRLYLELKLSGRPEKRRRMTTTNYNSDGGVVGFFFFHEASVITEQRSRATCYFPPVFMSVSFCHQLEDMLFPFFKPLTAAPNGRGWMLQLMFSNILAPFCLAWMAILYLHIAHQNSITIESALWKSKGHRLTAQIEFERYKRHF